MFDLYFKYILEILASVEEQFFELFKLTRSALSQHVLSASHTSLLLSCTWTGFDEKTFKGSICNQPYGQVLHRSFKDVFVGLEPGHNLLGPLILSMEVVEGSLNSLEVLQDLSPLCLQPGKD